MRAVLDALDVRNAYLAPVVCSPELIPICKLAQDGRNGTFIYFKKTTTVSANFLYC